MLLEEFYGGLRAATRNLVGYAGVSLSFCAVRSGGFFSQAF